MSVQDTVGSFVAEILANRHVTSDRGGPNAREVLLAMEVQKLRNLLGAAVEVMPNSSTKAAIESLGMGGTSRGDSGEGGRMTIVDPRSDCGDPSPSACPFCGEYLINAAWCFGGHYVVPLVGETPEKAAAVGVPPEQTGCGLKGCPGLDKNGVCPNGYGGTCEAIFLEPSNMDEDPLGVPPEQTP